MPTLVETAGGARLAARSGDTGRLIALSPQAEYELDRAGLRYDTPDGFERDADRMALGDANMTRAERLCAELDARLAALGPPVLPGAFRPAHASYFWLKVLVDVVTGAARTSQSILSADRSAVRLWAASGAEPIRPELDFLGESLYARVLPLVVENMGVTYEALPAGPWTVSGSGGAGLLARTLRSFARGARGRFAAARQRSQARRSDVRAEGTAIVLSADLVQPLLDHTSLDVILADTAAAFALRALRSSRTLPPRGLPGSGRRATLRDSWSGVAGAEALRSLLIVEGVDLFPAVADRLRYWWETLVPALCEGFERVSDALRSVRKPVVVSVEMFDHRMRTAAQAAHAAGVPVVTYQHGGTGFWEYPMLERTDLAESDFYLTWGAGVDDFIRRAHKGSKARTVPVGSLLVDRAVEELPSLRARRGDICRSLGLDPARPIIVYALGNLTGNQRYLSLHTCSDAQFWETQQAILGVLGEFPDVQSVVKLHPNRRMPQSPASELIRDKGWEHFRVVQSRPFEDLLPVADLFVIDAPATAVLQMLATGKRVLIFNDFYRFDPAALEQLRRCAIFSSDLGEFTTLLRDHIRERRFEPLARDNSFLKRYARPHDDGLSAERLARAVDAVSRGAEVAC